MRQRTIISLLLCSVLRGATLSGCTGSGDEEKQSVIDFVVYYGTTSGIIEEVMQSNQQVSQSNVDVLFDFSYTTSSVGDMTVFYFDPGDGSSRIENNAAENGEIEYTYATHGLFPAVIGAIDDQGNEYNETVTIRIDKQITWSQSGTANPGTMSIDARPDCTCPTPEKIDIDSTVENTPNSLGIGGQSVTVTWQLSNSTDVITAESQPEQVGDGQDATWVHAQYFIESGIWKLDVELSAEGNGDEQVNVDHTVLIVYDTEESIPNPMTAPVPEE